MTLVALTSVLLGLLVLTAIRTSADTDELTQLVALLGERVPYQTTCGDWQAEYAKLHAEILQRPEGQRKILVAVPNLSGLADRITGLVTVTTFAILTGRAIQVGRRPSLPNLETVFTSPYVNWTREEDPDWLIEPLKFKASERQYNQSVLDTHKYYGINTIDDWKLQDRFINSDINDLLDPNYETVLISMNRGKTIALFGNAKHADHLRSHMHLDHYTCFGCVLGFLMQPKPEIFQPVLPELKRLLDPETLYIGIQIRCGDDWLRDQNHAVDLSSWMGFFTCAQDIEHFAINRPNAKKTVKWFLVTDSMALRTKAVEQFGDKIITTMEAKIEHSSKEESTGACGQNGEDCSVSHAGFSVAAAEWWMLGACDYHIISKYSGFGRSAAFRSLRRDQIYTTEKGKQPSCGEKSFSDVYDMPYEWSGIRV